MKGLFLMIVTGKRGWLLGFWAQKVPTGYDYSGFSLVRQALF